MKKHGSCAEQQKTTLEKQKAAAQQQVGTLEEQTVALLAASHQQQKQYQDLVQGLSKEVEKGQLQVRQYKNMLSVDLAEQIFFDSGRATLKKEGKEVLKSVGEALKNYENKIIRRVGHTDNVPVAKSLQSTYPVELGAFRRPGHQRRALPAGSRHSARTHGPVRPGRIRSRGAERYSGGTSEEPPDRDHADQKSWTTPLPRR